MLNRSNVQILLLSLALLKSPLAWANREEAKQYFVAGQQAFYAKDYLTAIRAFKWSFAAHPHPRILFATAGAYRRQFELDRDPQKLSEAIDLYRQFVKQAPRSPYRPTADSELIQLLAIAARMPEQSNVLQPKQPAPPATTQLMVTSQTPTARIVIDNEPQEGEPAPAIRVVAPGAHHIKVQAPGFQSLERKIVAVKSRLVVANLNLVPLPGSIRVLSNKEGAKVYLDGQPVGKIPLVAERIGVGKRQLAVTHRGHKIWSGQIEVKSNETAVAMANLNWSVQRKLAVSIGIGAAGLGLASLLTGVFAITKDASLDGLPTQTNKQRQTYDDTLDERDALATSSTVLAVAGTSMLITAALLYWFDLPETPISAARQIGLQSAGPALRFSF